MSSMASLPSTFATLRALHLVIGDALDDIQRVFVQNSLPDPPHTPASQLSSPVFSRFPDGSSPATSPFPTTPPTSFPPTPLSATFPPSQCSHPNPLTNVPLLDYPSPDLPHLPDSASEKLALHPDAASAASRIVAACGQMSNIVHKPFSSLCDAIMNYNLPACMRLVEHLHIVEILREADENRQRDPVDGRDAAVSSSGAKVESDPREGPPVKTPGDVDPSSRARKNIEGLHVVDITNVICSYAGKNYVDPSDLVHALRLLSTHHIFRETAPDTFALNRVASLLDTGKSVAAVFTNPESKYDDTGEISAFVALMTDELFKAAAYLTEAFTNVQLPSRMPSANNSFPAEPILSETTTLPSSSMLAANGAALCVAATRSSSVLTHIVYPQDSQDAQPTSSTRPSTGPLKKTHPTLVDVPPCLDPVEPSTKVGKEDPPSGGAAECERLSAFSLAFHTSMPYFDWLENGGEDLLGGTGQGAGACTQMSMQSSMQVTQLAASSGAHNAVSRKPFRLKRFSRAMTGTTGWEAPKAILGGFDWYSLPKGSTIVDVGGGIGSTTMILASALNDLRADSPLMASDERDTIGAKEDANLRFVVQDKPAVTALGVEAWCSKFPEMLETGEVVFQDQDFFEPQSASESYPAVYLLRVVLHDWPDDLARRILINLRVASSPVTRLVIAEHVLPLACVDEDVLDHMSTEASRTGEWTLNSVLAHVEGAERTLVPPPLLSNLGKASANAYWMDLTMHISLNGKERTLREFCALALSAGWRVMRMTRPRGSLFAYLVCEPIALPDDAQAIYNAVVLSSELSTVIAVPTEEPAQLSHVDPSRDKRLPPQPAPLLPSPVVERPPSRCTTPTFGSRIFLPKDEELLSPRTRGNRAAKWLKSKGLGVRGVMMQKAEKQKGEQNSSKGTTADDHCDVQRGVSTSSPSHVRVWWKKSPPNPTSNGDVVVHELNSPQAAPLATRRGRRGTPRLNDSPSTPSPRLSPVHHTWPSIESTPLPIPETSPRGIYAHRPSVASITRKLSFVNFGRRPSVPDVTEPLPTPPPSATLVELAPPAVLQADTARHLKHLPSLPTLRQSESITTTGEPRSGRRRPSLSIAGGPPPPLPRRPDVTDSPKSGILKPRTSPNTSVRSSPRTPHSTTSTSTPNLVPRRQRRVTLSNAPGGGLPKPHWQTQDPRAAPEVKRMPSMPKLPHRLSIPILRRKQSQPVMPLPKGEDEG